MGSTTTLLGSGGLPAIPAFSTSGVLPPFLGADVTNPATMSPYQTDALGLVDRFATSPERKQILSGFLDFRAQLRSLGLFGFQWLNGSFCEDIESTELRPPRDIDVVTFFTRPQSVLSPADWKAFVSANQSLFDPRQTKTAFQSDAYFVDLSVPAVNVVSSTRYWFGLFSHKRSIGLWKGMLQLDLNLSDDSNAMNLLASK